MNRVCKRWFYIYFYHGPWIIKNLLWQSPICPHYCAKKEIPFNHPLDTCKDPPQMPTLGSLALEKSLGKGYPCFFLCDHALYFCRTSVFAVMLCKRDPAVFVWGVVFFLYLAFHLHLKTLALSFIQPCVVCIRDCVEAAIDIRGGGGACTWWISNWGSPISGDLWWNVLFLYV